MNWFEKIKKYYDKGIYSDEDVRIFVAAEKITEEQFKEITNTDY